MVNPTESKLSKAYESVEGHLNILKGVKRGELYFFDEIRKNGLSDHPHISQVHSYDDVEVQAFILGIPSKDVLEEIAIKSFLTYGAHLIDDFFDRPDLDPFPEKMDKYRGNIKTLLDNIGSIGRFGHAMAEKTDNPDGVYKGLHRMLYGGLIQLTSNEEEQRKYLEEHKQIGLEGVDVNVKLELNGVGTVPYWMTTKTVQEFILAAEPQLDLTMCELWNFAYAPALYLHDSQEEEVKGELGFLGQEKPTVPEMVEMIDIASRNIRSYENERAPLKLQQLRFLRQAFDSVFPEEIRRAYDDLDKNLRELALPI